ncbi:MAG TPA: hypothetical protein PLD09_00015 [Methanomassiliicoccaceae archaeon]|nr:hypothetical protein [Methanomassiliicoccaceae archaeon]HQA20241.1 hypothetical protein [Methanomassiliicoccaceae archaeon]HQD87269.1 hypothetical protein [Methanomassiliicoccaceae archaeon]
MNTLIILLDGAADDKIPEFDGRTPLASFEKPFMDMVASNGIMGWTESRPYTHLYLLEFFTGKRLDTPRGLVEAVGLGVPVDPNQVAYRFSPAYFYESNVDWAYRVTPELSSSLQDAMVRNLDMLGDLNPRLYFYEDGRGVMTVDTEDVVPFPMPPTPPSSSKFPMHHFGDYIRKVASEMDGLSIIPWGGGSLAKLNGHAAIPEVKNMVMISKSPSALGVGGLLHVRRDVVDNMWSGFQEAFRLLQSGDVFMHVEETDDISHRRAPDEKVGMLKEVDDLLMENLDRLIGHRVAFIVDHGTSSITGQHLNMKVPFAVSEVVEPSEPTVRFCENEYNYTPLGDLAKVLLDHGTRSDSL